MENVNIDDLVLELRARVAARRRAGEYPIGLERQLEAEFDAIMAGSHRPEISTEPLSRAAGSVMHVANTANVVTPNTSSVPGGSLAHAVAGRVVRRHTRPIADAVTALGVEIARALEEVRALMDRQRDADAREIKTVIAAVLDRLAIIDQLAVSVADLERRVDDLDELRKRVAALEEDADAESDSDL